MYVIYLMNIIQYTCAILLVSTCVCMIYIIYSILDISQIHSIYVM